MKRLTSSSRATAVSGSIIFRVAHAKGMKAAAVLNTVRREQTSFDDDEDVSYCPEGVEAFKRSGSPPEAVVAGVNLRTAAGRAAIWVRRARAGDGDDGVKERVCIFAAAWACRGVVVVVVFL